MLYFAMLGHSVVPLISLPAGFMLGSVSREHCGKTGNLQDEGCGFPVVPVNDMHF